MIQNIEERFPYFELDMEYDAMHKPLNTSLFPVILVYLSREGVY